MFRPEDARWASRAAQLRDEARAIAPALGAETQMAVLDRLVGAQGRRARLPAWHSTGIYMVDSYQ